jgi:hypothetical protein
MLHNESFFNSCFDLNKVSPSGKQPLTVQPLFSSYTSQIYSANTATTMRTLVSSVLLAATLVAIVTGLKDVPGGGLKECQYTFDNGTTTTFQDGDKFYPGKCSPPCMCFGMSNPFLLCVR